MASTTFFQIHSSGGGIHREVLGQHRMFVAAGHQRRPGTPQVAPLLQPAGQAADVGLPSLAEVLRQRGQVVEIDGDRRFRPFEEAPHAGRGRQQILQHEIQAVQHIVQPALDADLLELFPPGLAEGLAPYLDLRRPVRIARSGTQQDFDQNVPGLAHRGLDIAGLETENRVFRAVP